jgi:ABC-type transport system involved in cytochrome c biogenesis permease subunit
MTNESLAGYANLSLYSAMAVFTIAMVCHAIYLAALLPARDQLRGRAVDRDSELVTAGAGAVSGVGGPPLPAQPAEGELSSRTRTAAGIAATTTWLGGFLLVLSVALRGLAVHRWPLGNMFEFAVMGSMFTVLAYSTWSTRRDLRWLGLFITGPVLLVLGMAVAVWYTEASELMPSLRSYWLVIHVTVATLATAVFTIGAALTAVYLLKDAFERSGRASVLDRFPETPAIERTAYSLHIVAFPLWTFVIFVVYSAYLHSRATSGISRQTASFIALAGYACIIVNFAVVNVFFVGQHSYSGL